MRHIALAAALLLAWPAQADMYQDAGNAKLPEARANLGWVNTVALMDDQFGAKCDGVTNDAAAIQAAIDATPQGGVLLLPAGKYCKFASTVTVGKSISIRTDGPGSAQLFWTGNATDDHVVVGNNTGPYQTAAVRYIAAGGSGYAVGNTITLNDACGTHTTLLVQRVTAGAVTDARIQTQGACTARPSANTPQTQLSTSGGGTGATFAMFYGSQSAKVNSAEFHNLTFGSDTVMTAGCAIRGDYTYQFGVSHTRIYGNNQIWQGLCLSRAITTKIDHLLADNLLAESIVLSGTDGGAQATSDVWVDHTILQGCNKRPGLTKAQAQQTGCIRLLDYASALFARHTEVFGGFKGYAVFFDGRFRHGGYINDLNVEGGPDAGSIGGDHISPLFVSGSSWLTGTNLDTIRLGPASDGVQFDPSTSIGTSTSDGSSTPAGVYVEGINVNIAGVLIGNYNTAGGNQIGVYLGPASNQVHVGSKAQIRQMAGGGITGPGTGIYTLDAVFQGQPSDLAAPVTCASFRGIKTAVSSAGTVLCPLTATAAGMPANCTGAASGTLWNNAGVVNICP